MRDHAVDIACADEECKARSAEAQKVGIGFPVRLCEHGDRIAVRFEQAADDRRTEARVIDIGIAADIYKIRLCNAAFPQLLHCHREKAVPA
jgi:hypothetical protein